MLRSLLPFMCRISLATLSATSVTGCIADDGTGGTPHGCSITVSGAVSGTFACQAVAGEATNGTYALGLLTDAEVRPAIIVSWKLATRASTQTYDQESALEAASGVVMPDHTAYAAIGGTTERDHFGTATFVITGFDGPSNTIETPHGSFDATLYKRDDSNTEGFDPSVAVTMVATF
ncbi:MAG: hypothetical protein H0T42_23340 [Deltaproteobacteria bacterium]|nr:hypothetical protein [Deltaproteobacteria bacterium]